MADPFRQTPTMLDGAQWLATPLVTRIFRAIAEGGGSARVIGGAVRNALLGIAISDIDMASDLLPEQVIACATRAGLTTYPTGLAHGTVTVVGNGNAIEVTTLRRDVETDGRHAVVAFTRDWREDALRRDFTINALSCDADGRIYDPVGGLADLAARRVRFIGEAGARIREDYLRILRFFRFTSAYATGPCDASGLAAASALRSGLRQLSAERVGSEMLKFIVTPRAGELADVMDASGIFAALSSDAAPLVARPERLRHLQAIEQALGDAPDAITRLAALFVGDAADADAIGRTLRLSNAEVADLAMTCTPPARVSPDAGEHAAKAALYRLGQPAFERAVRLAWAASSAHADHAAWHNLRQLPDRWRAPKMPFSGSDVLALGLAPGPRIGRTLRAFETWWISEDFPEDTDGQRARLAALAAQS